MATLKEGAFGAVGVAAGRGGVRAVVKLIPFGGGSAIATLGKGALAAILVQKVVRMVSPRMASYALAGAMLEVISPYLTQIPVVGPMLGDDSYLHPWAMGQNYLGYGNTPGSFLGAYAGGSQGLGAYAGGFSAYPALVGISGDDGD